MEKTSSPTAIKKYTTSGPTRVASSVFLVVGLFSFIDTVKILQNLLPSQSGLKPLYAFVIIWSIAALITSNYLSKGKKWSYILAFILIASLFGLNAYTYFGFGSMNIINLAVSVVTIFLLILGRKDFTNK